MHIEDDKFEEQSRREASNDDESNEAELMDQVSLMSGDTTALAE